MRLPLPVGLLRGGFQGLPSRSGKCLLHLLGEQDPPHGAGISLLLQEQVLRWATGTARESRDDGVRLSHAGVPPGQRKWCPSSFC